MSVRVWSVGELTRRIKDLLEVEIDAVWVRGEISSWKVHPASGHAYFTLKEERAVLACVAWSSTVRHLTRTLRLRDGLRVRAFGHISVYEPRGIYQLVCEQMLDEGEGELQAAFQRLKLKLEAEGLFDAARKRPLPRLPRRIGIVTSASGAALRDMLRILGRRWPLAEVVLRPAAVQGEGAAAELAAGIADLNALGGIDVLIVGRGGGSLEDLWAFNEEELARAIYGSGIPVISAVGHEVDFTISDFVADVRAATPTHAAELAVPDQEEMRDRLRRDGRSVTQALRRKMEGTRLRLERLFMSRGLRRPEELLRRGRLDLDRLADRMREILSGRAERGMASLHLLDRRLRRQDPAARLAVLRGRLDELGRRGRVGVEARRLLLDRRVAIGAARLEALGPHRVLARGYGIVSREADGVVVRRSDQVRVGEQIRVRLHAGGLLCEVEAVNGAGPGKEVAG